MFSICLVVVLLMGVVTGGVFYGLYRTSLRASCQAAAETIRLAVEDLAAGYAELLMKLEAEEGIRSFMAGDSRGETALVQELYMLRNSFSQRAALSAIRLSDGRCVSTSKEVLSNRNAEFSNWGVFREANRTDGVASYAVARDLLLSQEDRICLALACRDGDGTPLGYLMAEIPRSALEQVTLARAEPYNASTLLVNRSASVIYHSGGTELEGLGRARACGFERGMERAGSGVTAQSYAFSAGGTLGVTVLREIPSGTASVVLKPFLLAVCAGVLVVALLALVSSRRLARTVCGPIEEMIGVMGRIEEGDLSLRLNFRREDEIGQLGRAFDSMTGRVQELMARSEEEKHGLWVAETRSLSLQMNPHFLFNTLDLIKWNAKLGKNEDIVSITVLLGKVLRRIMSTKDDLVAVSYELELVSAFVEIQKKRYGERLSLEAAVEEEILPLLIPKLVLQPIVENAIVHGFSGRAEPCRIQITGRRKRGGTGGLLEFRIADNGAGMDERELAHILEFKQEGMHHIGLYNVQRRARLFGDESCGVTVESRKGEGTTVTLVLKAREKGGNHACTFG